MGDFVARVRDALADAGRDVRRGARSARCPARSRRVGRRRASGRGHAAPQAGARSRGHPESRPIRRRHLSGSVPGLRARDRPRASATARRVRRPGAARLGRHPRLRALRHLLATVPDVPGARAGDGLAARACLPDARRDRGADRPDRQLPPPHGPVPRVPRVRDGVSGRRAVRSPHRGDARTDRAEGASPVRTPDPRPTPARRASRQATSRARSRADPPLPGPRASAPGPGIGTPRAFPAPLGDGAAAASAACPVDSQAPGRDSARRPLARHGGGPRGVRAGGPLPRRESCDREPAGAGRLPRRGPRGAGLLRSAAPSLGRPGGRPRAGTAQRGELQGRGLDRHERRRLRRDAARLRAPAERRPGGPGPGRAGARRHGAPGRAPAGSSAAARSHGDVPRALPPRPRSARAGGAADSPPRDPGTAPGRARRVRSLLRLRGSLQPDGARDCRTSFSSESSTGSPPPAPRSWRAAILAVSSSSVEGSPTGALDVRAYHPVELLAWSVEGRTPAGRV